jgi:hypothetical protein
MRFASLTLELTSPLHAGAGRAGMVARSHGFVPGHLLSYALAAAVGAARGGAQADYAAALTQIRARLRCGPLLLESPVKKGQGLFPYRDRQAIEQNFIFGSHHVTLHADACSAAEGALFEVEAISAQVLRGPARGTPARLLGGVWFADKAIDGVPLQTWIGRCRLGGEPKTGLGRIRVAEWREGNGNYAGVGAADGAGLRLRAGAELAGPALSGVDAAPWQPWVGRLFDPEQGFGRRLSPARLVRLDGVATGDARFLPSDQEPGLGCWEVSAA